MSTGKGNIDALSGHEQGTGLVVRAHRVGSRWGEPQAASPGQAGRPKAGSERPLRALRGDEGGHRTPTTQSAP